MSLLQAVVKKGESVRYLSLPGTTVVTKPSPGLSDFLRQMHRWSIGGLELGWKAVIFVISSIALWIGIIAAAAFWEPLWLIGIFLLRLVGDFILIAPAFMSIKYKRLIKWIFPAVLFFTFLELIVPFQLMNKKVKWKGQVFHGKKN